mgnify:CR=1 FL=1
MADPHEAKGFLQGEAGCLIGAGAADERMELGGPGPRDEMLEDQSPQATAVKIVGDVAWEEARGSGLTSIDIDSFQNDDNVSGRVRRLRNWREKYLSGANEVVVPSEYLKRLVSGWGVPQEKIRVIYNGVSLPHNNGAVPRYRSEDRPLQVIFVGRLTNWKGVETLLLAVNKLEGIDVHILGDGPEYPML